MGHENLDKYYRDWASNGSIGGTAHRLAAYMAHRCRDTDFPPVFHEGWEALAQAAGLGKGGANANSQKQAVSKRLAELKRAGLVVSSGQAGPGVRENYALALDLEVTFIPEGEGRNVTWKPVTRAEAAQQQPSRAKRPKVEDPPREVLDAEIIELEDQPEATPSRVAANRFDEFWKAYPRKVGKQKAITKYKAAVKRAESEQQIIDGAQRLREDPNREDQYTPHPTTWLERNGWEDDPIPRALTPSEKRLRAGLQMVRSWSERQPDPWAEPVENYPQSVGGFGQPSQITVGRNDQPVVGSFDQPVVGNTDQPVVGSFEHERLAEMTNPKGTQSKSKETSIEHGTNAQRSCATPPRSKPRRKANGEEDERNRQAAELLKMIEAEQKAKTP